MTPRLLIHSTYINIFIFVSIFFNKLSQISQKCRLSHGLATATLDPTPLVHLSHSQRTTTPRIPTPPTPASPNAAVVHPSLSTSNSSAVCTASSCTMEDPTLPIRLSTFRRPTSTPSTSPQRPLPSPKHRCQQQQFRVSKPNFFSEKRLTGDSQNLTPGLM